MDTGVVSSVVTIVISQTSITITTISTGSQTVTVSESVIGMGVSVVTSIEDSGVCFSISITTFTGSTGNGNVERVNTWGRFDSSSISCIWVSISGSNRCGGSNSDCWGSGDNISDCWGCNNWGGSSMTIVS